MTRAFGILALTLAIVGCGGPGGNATPQQQKELHALVFAYHNYHEANKKGPPDAKDFRGFAMKANDAPAQLALEAVDRGEYIVFYGVSFKQMLEGTSNTVLIYQKDVPTKGGPVAMADGVIKTMTADEFAKAPKAGK